MRINNWSKALNTGDFITQQPCLYCHEKQCEINKTCKNCQRNWGFFVILPKFS